MGRPRYGIECHIINVEHAELDGCIGSIVIHPHHERRVLVEIQIGSQRRCTDIDCGIWDEAIDVEAGVAAVGVELGCEEIVRWTEEERGVVQKSVMRRDKEGDAICCRVGRRGNELEVEGCAEGGGVAPPGEGIIVE